MIEFRLSIDALGRTRFGYSPLAEVTCSLRALGSPSPGFVLRPWVQQVRGRLDAVDLRLLMSVCPPGRWGPDFMLAWSPDRKITIERQLAGLADLPAEIPRRQLIEVWDGRPPPEVTHLINDGRAGCRRLAEAIWDYWQLAISPCWSRIRSVVDDEVSYRAIQVLSGRLYNLLSDLHPEVSLRDQVLYIDKPQHADATYGEAEITMIPSVFVWPNLIIAHDTPGRFDLTFAARGVGRVWEDLPQSSLQDEGLGALLGRTRATILNRLAIPMTTTQLAQQLQQSPGSVSQHLSVLRRTGLLTSRRSGRNVVYRHTPLAASILAAAGDTANGRTA
jgi:DNA-binding transcriptional ArsR family regulator